MCADLTVAFRADASIRIGTGHVIRCLTLADALRNRGVKCHFLCREQSGSLANRIAALGFAISRLSGTRGSNKTLEGEIGEAPHAALLGVDWNQDAGEVVAVLRRIQPSWLVVDHYALSRPWEERVSQEVPKLLVVDDLADRHHSCDVLLDQSLGRSGGDYAGLVPPRCHIFAGPEYALLRPQFSELREVGLLRRQSGKIQNLLISMGGVDQPNATGRVLEALRSCALEADTRISVVLGEHSPWAAKVNDLASLLPWHVEVHQNVANMAQMMVDADLAIGAAGSTSWERCCVGLPSILVTLADNQQHIATSLSAYGAALSVGNIADAQFPEALRSSLLHLAANPAQMRSMANAASSITDGTGTQRVAEFITSELRL